MDLPRGQLCQGTQHEGIFQDLRARQLHALDDARGGAVGENIDVQLARAVAAGIGRAAVLDLHMAQAAGEFSRAQVGVDSDHQVQEGLAGKSDSLAVVDRGQGQLAEQALQGIQPGDDIALALDIAAHPEEDRRHQGCSGRSITTPTSAAWATAPGLARRRRSQDTANSSRRMSARRSARVSISWKSLASI